MNPYAQGTPERDAWYESRIAELVAENASLRIYSPAQRAQPTIKTEPIGRTNFAFYGIETDEEFAAKGREYTEVAG